LRTSAGHDQCTDGEQRGDAEGNFFHQILQRNRLEV
jgi:hypothetical protein